MENRKRRGWLISILAGRCGSPGRCYAESMTAEDRAEACEIAAGLNERETQVTACPAIAGTEEPPKEGTKCLGK